MPLWLRHHVLVLAVAGPILFFQLGQARLWDRDEPRNARCAVEMLERHDWVTPYFNGELRTHKPVLLYWLIMASYGLFGMGEFAARFSSAVMGLGTVVCTYHLGKRLFGRSAGLWSALALAPAIMFGLASRAATPDASLIFFVTAAITAYVLFAFRAEEPAFPKSWQAAVVYGLMALAVLAKGPVGFMLPATIIAASLWITRFASANGSTVSLDLSGLRLRNLLSLVAEMRPLTALAMLLVVAAPWYAWVGYRTEGEWLVGFFWDHNVRRATETMEGHRGPGVIFYPLTLLIGFFPASIFLLPAVCDGCRRVAARDRHTAGIIFCLMWIVAIVGAFSLAKTKLPSYVTPCYPALALLVGTLIDRWTVDSLAISRWWLRWSVACQAIVGLAVVGALYGVAGRYLPGEQWLCAIGGVLAVGGGCAFALQWRRSYTAAAGLSLGAGAVFSLLLFGLGPAAADRHQQSHVLVQALVSAEGASEVAAYHCLEPSWVFYLRRPIQELPGGEQAVAHLRGSGERRLVIREQDYHHLAGQLPPDVQLLARAPAFLKRDMLLVLGRGDSVARRKDPAEKTR